MDIDNNKLAYNNLQNYEYDLEWIRLILNAKQDGFSPTEIRVFLQQAVQKSTSL